MCPGHNHRTRLANVTETHFNQTIVLYVVSYRSVYQTVSGSQGGAKETMVPAVLNHGLGNSSALSTWHKGGRERFFVQGSSVHLVVDRFSPF